MATYADTDQNQYKHATKDTDWQLVSELDLPLFQRVAHAYTAEAVGQRPEVQEMEGGATGGAMGSATGSASGGASGDASGSRAGDEDDDD